MVILYFLLAYFLVGDCDSSKQPPVVSQSFVVNTREVDYTNTTVVEQRLAWDVVSRRTAMYAEGSLVKGALQQIKRCDLSPRPGWMSSAGGPDVNNPPSWSCTNGSIPISEELSSDNCGIGNFWEFPPSKFEGYESIEGKVCGKYTYWMSGEEYGIWVTDDAIPCASGKIKSAVNNLWMIYFNSFSAGSPDLDEFLPKPGCDCPQATNSIEKARQGTGHITQLIGSIQDILTKIH
jgi:hypothetical protein